MSGRDDLCSLVNGLDVEPQIALEAMRRVQGLVDDELLNQVGRARKSGVSWGGIGGALGVTASNVISRTVTRSGAIILLNTVVARTAVHVAGSVGVGTTETTM